MHGALIARPSHLSVFNLISVFHCSLKSYLLNKGKKKFQGEKQTSMDTFVSRREIINGLKQRASTERGAQMALAKALKISQSFLSLVIRRKRLPSAAMLKRLGYHIEPYYKQKEAGE